MPGDVADVGVDVDVGAGGHGGGVGGGPLKSWRARRVDGGEEDGDGEGDGGEKVRRKVVSALRCVMVNGILSTSLIPRETISRLDPQWMNSSDDDPICDGQFPP